MSVHEIKAHLGRFLGPPGETHLLDGNPDKSALIQRLEIPYFHPEQKLRHAVFATVGASAYAMSDGGRVEGLWIMRRVPERSMFGAIHALLASFATHAETHRAVLDMGDVIEASASLRALAPMTHLMLAPPIPVARELRALELADGSRIDFAWLLPLYANEAEASLLYGAQSLMAAFALEGLDPTEVSRPPLDTSKSLPDLDSVLAALKKKPSFDLDSGGDVIRITRRGARPKKL